MSNSSLVTYKNITSDKTSPRKNKIDTITIHCYVGQVTAKQGCDYFASSSRQVSSNYVVGYDGSIGLSVDEKDRAWTSGGYDENGRVIRANGISGADNDHRAVTIEVACDSDKPYAITDKAYTALINLVTDICKRNDIKQLKWKGDKSLVGKIAEQNMTVHRWFARTECPGDFLYEHMDDIARAVNEKLTSKTDTDKAPTKTPSKELYRVRKVWTDVKSQKGAFSSLPNAKKCADDNPGYKVFNSSGKAVYTSKAKQPAVKKPTLAPAQSFKNALSGRYKVADKSGLNLRYVPGELTASNVVAVIPNGAVVNNYGYFTDVDGVRWLLVAYNGNTGFIHSGYVRKL